MAHDVFLSYCQKDKATADAVCRALEHSSVRVWMAPRNIPAGANWSEAIPKAIVEARALVLVFSAGANSSSYIPRELALAADKNKPIITIRLANVHPSNSVEFFISTLQWIDAFPPPLDAHLNNLVRMTRDALGMRAQSPLPIAKPTPRAGTGPSAPAALPAPAQEFQPKQTNRRKIAAVIAGIVILVAAGVSFKSMTSDTVATLLPGFDCSDADTGSGALPGMDQPEGLFKVLAVDTLQVDGRCIRLSGVGTIVSNQVSSLSNWMHDRGNTVQCEEEQPFHGRYTCNVGNDRSDVADYVIRRRWAKPTQDASAQN